MAAYGQDNENAVEADDERRAGPAGDLERHWVRMDAQDIAFAGEPDERNQGEGYAEAEQDLAEYQGDSRFDAPAEDGEGPGSG